MKNKILVIDDDHMFNEMLCEALKDEGYMPVGVLSLKEARKKLYDEYFHCVLLDLRLPDGNGMELVEMASTISTVIVMSAHGDIRSAVNAVKKGAFNFLEKPFELNHALIEIKRAINYRKLELENEELSKLTGGERKLNLVGNSTEMVKIKKTIDTIANKSVSVLIEGESGTGKEVVANLIHRLSGRKKFVALNCSAIPENLFESELFGHEKGAFTGADTLKKGMVEDADGGTLFLDEISEMPLSLQPKLLRFLESGSFKRLGSIMAKRVNVRLICATNRNLLDEVEKGRFRADLYYRLNVVKIAIPPLRNRIEDIAPLVNYFIPLLKREIGIAEDIKVSEDFIEALMNYKWPGNVRELRNVLLSIIAIYGDHGVLETWMLPEDMQKPEMEKKLPLGEMPLEELEKDYTERLLRKYNGNKTKVARVLGISKSTLYTKLKRWKLD
ncbi:Fis family transcriptional regulator [Kosmotoga arenicorallina S304]|uniref:Fis family transcriptional regulator n=1 Tax=Kosmotoga arenicorallina S304 TaxID=1453497 RepID=A0A176K2S1_9BACT|nr:sigma-54 dependent transcriptional regulator [Kosmotoga arenicorallina]OAA31272.1 Fis family transcriptional regulator [Kosmotoga arenicorallina S304]